MKVIGSTVMGSYIAEINHAEMVAIKEVIKGLSELISSRSEMFGGDGLVALSAPVTEGPVPTWVEQRPLVARPKAKKGAVKLGERLCVICGKPIKGGSALRKVCSKPCLLAKNRAAANAAYAKKHPQVKPQTAARLAPPAAGSRVDRVDLIRQAQERLEQRQREEQD